MVKSTSSNKNVVNFLRNNPVSAFAGVTVVVLMALLLLTLIH